MALFDFQMVKGFRKGTWFIFGFYSSHISQKVSRPWEGLQPIFRFLKWCFRQKYWGVSWKLNLKNRIGRQVTNVSAVHSACHHVGAHTSRGHCSCTVDLSSTLSAGIGFFFLSSRYVHPPDLKESDQPKVNIPGFSFTFANNNRIWPTSIWTTKKSISSFPWENQKSKHERSADFRAWFSKHPLSQLLCRSLSLVFFVFLYSPETVLPGLETSSRWHRNIGCLGTMESFST